MSIWTSLLMHHGYVATPTALAAVSEPPAPEPGPGPVAPPPPTARPPAPPRRDAAPPRAQVVGIGGRLREPASPCYLHPLEAVGQTR